MQDSLLIQLLARAARAAPTASAAVDPAAPLSILSLAATSYGSRPAEDMTTPTGFDPAAVVLFETIVEGAFLVANADDVFDEQERRMFERVVVEACRGTVSPQQITHLVAELTSQLQLEGMDRRIEALATSIAKKEHAQEVLRVAALVAQVSEGSSAVEREVLGRLAQRCGLSRDQVDAALAGAKKALEGATPASGPARD